MVTVDSPTAGDARTPSSRGHAACGLVGLGVVLAAFASAYPAIVAAADDVLGVLSGASIVWLFVVAWLLLWLGLDAAVVGWAGRRA